MFVKHLSRTHLQNSWQFQKFKMAAISNIKVCTTQLFVVVTLLAAQQICDIAISLLCMNGTKVMFIKVCVTVKIKCDNTGEK